MAEFKVRLFHFFAERLRRWAGTIESEIVPETSSPVKRIAEAGAVRPTDSSSEASREAGPPEHWTRLFRTTPPTHWLELFDQKSPAIDDAEFGDETSGTEVFNLETATEVREARDLSSQDDATRKPQQPRRRVSQDDRETLKTESPSAIGKRWLNRLRFSPPPPRGTSDEPTFIQAERTRDQNSVDYSAEKSSGANKRYEPSFPQPPRKRDSEDQSFNEMSNRSLKHSAQRSMVSQENDFKAPGNSRDERRVTDISAMNYAKAQPAKAQRLSDEPARQRSSKQTPLESERVVSTTETPRSQDNAGNYSERTERVSRARSSKPDQLRNMNSEREDYSQPVFSKVDRDTSLDFPGVVSAKGRNQSAVSPETKKRSSALGATKSLATDFISSREQPRGELPFVEESPQSRSRNKSNFNSSTNSNIDSEPSRWPVLPPAPSFGIADELLARDADAEALRRLESEQRGNQWNA